MMHWIRKLAARGRPVPDVIDEPLPEDLLLLFDDFTPEQIVKLPRKLRARIYADRQRRVTARLQVEIGMLRA